MAHTCSFLLVAAAVLAAVPLHAGSASSSAVAARELVGAMQARGLEAIAARDPGNQDRFIAALLITDSQLLVVSARYSAPPALAYRLAHADYREAYLDLQGAGDRDGKLFVQDLGADGFDLSLQPGGAADLVYENGGAGFLLNGDPKAHKLDRAAYRRRVSELDARYAQVLGILRDAIREAGPADGRPAQVEAAVQAP